MNDRALNQTVAELFRQMAEVLAQQQANPFRINAYRRAAETIEALEEDVGAILERDGVDGLIALPFIGKGTAASIQEIARTGRLSQLDRLRGELEPEQLFQTVPGIGPALAEQIVDELHADTLEALEMAAHDGRLQALKGVGVRRAAGIRSSLADMLGRRGPGRRRLANGPDIGLLLNIDRAYRTKARGGKLPTIAPRRFNPDGEAWLPIMHAHRGGWHFTVLFSNTARAHQLRRTRDWVVIYFSDGDHREGQHTVVTETHGPLKDLRVVRGREAECRTYYRRGGRVVGG